MKGTGANISICFKCSASDSGWFTQLIPWRHLWTAVQTQSLFQAAACKHLCQSTIHFVTSRPESGLRREASAAHGMR